MGPLIPPAVYTSCAWSLEIPACYQLRTADVKVFRNSEHYMQFMEQISTLCYIL